MRIKEFTIKNFKNIGHNEPCKVTFPRVDGEGASDFITIVIGIMIILYFN
ncbi:hypothetical protein [Rossellomorea marisflavi]|nr:hypothetical protein [Rossellomorea marisflavi]